MRYLKSQAPPDVAASIQAIEDRADKCFESLRLITIPKDVAIWAVLTAAAGRIEAEITEHGDDTGRFSALLLNFSYLSTVAINWMRKYGRRGSTLPRVRRWNVELASSAEEALALAHSYGVFLFNFPMWHADRYAAELLSSTQVRFTIMDSTKGRQVNAYQKGFRPKVGKHKGVRNKKPDVSKELNDLFSAALESCRPKGRGMFLCPAPIELWCALKPEYSARMDALFRRDDSISLGSYSLGEFKAVYTALLAISAAHEHLCFRWGQLHQEYPINSAVLVKPPYRWAQSLSDISGIPHQTCNSILKDLTLGATRSLDLHVHPFVPFDEESKTLALLPQFPLHSRPDENILRVCSYLRPDAFNMAADTKEPEMRADLESIPSQFSIKGPGTLPKPIPNVDLIVEDVNSSTVVIGEMKWIRKPLRALERIERDADVLKGINQLKDIKSYLRSHPNHLSLQGILTHPLDWYRHVYFLLIARDHFVWVEPEEEVAILGFDVFSAMLGESTDLNVGTAELLRYNWLPVEGRDFVIRYERAVANGVSLESEAVFAL